VERCPRAGGHGLAGDRRCFVIDVGVLNSGGEDFVVVLFLDLNERSVSERDEEKKTRNLLWFMFPSTLPRANDLFLQLLQHPHHRLQPPLLLLQDLDTRLLFRPNHQFGIQLGVHRLLGAKIDRDMGFFL
jgi:hypothetical protein